jgi:hypothetical protein
MRTLDPNRELDEFQSRADDSYARYARLFRVVSGAHDVNALRKGLAVDAAFRLGSEWETFQHSWHVAAIAKDSTKLIASERQRIEEIVSKVPEANREVFNVTFTHQNLTRLKGSDIERLLDPQNRNITFADTSAWREQTNKYLSRTYMAKVNRIYSSDADSCVLELLKSLRNAIAHGSLDAKARLNRAVRPRANQLGISGPENDALLRDTYGIRDIGTYLHGWTGATGLRLQPEGTRVALIHTRVADIAKLLRV